MINTGDILGPRNSSNQFWQNPPANTLNTSHWPVIPPHEDNSAFRTPQEQKFFNAKMPTIPTPRPPFTTGSLNGATNNTNVWNPLDFLDDAAELSFEDGSKVTVKEFRIGLKLMIKMAKEEYPEEFI